MIVLCGDYLFRGEILMRFTDSVLCVMRGDTLYITQFLSFARMRAGPVMVQELCVGVITSMTECIKGKQDFFHFRPLLICCGNSFGRLMTVCCVFLLLDDCGPAGRWVFSLPGELLSQHYESIMPILKQLLSHAQARGLEGLWGQGLECCALLGEASGKVRLEAEGGW